MSGDPFQPIAPSVDRDSQLRRRTDLISDAVEVSATGLQVLSLPAMNGLLLDVRATSISIPTHVGPEGRKHVHRGLRALWPDVSRWIQWDARPVWYGTYWQFTYYTPDQVRVQMGPRFRSLMQANRFISWYGRGIFFSGPASSTRVTSDGTVYTASWTPLS